MKLSVILISYNTRTMTLDCLEKLQKGLMEVESEIWVVDNASSDGSADAVTANFPSIRLIASKYNMGFGAANNLAMSHAEGDFYLLLNTDAFIHTDGLSKLISYLDKNPRVGVVGPRLLNEDGSHQESVHMSPSVGQSWAHVLGVSSLKHRFIPQSKRSTGFIKKNEYLKAACILVRREVWVKTGGFDEKFFFYGEDADWGRRIALAEFDVAYLDEATAIHLSGKSSRHWIYSTLLNYSAMEYLIWKRSKNLGVHTLHLSWIVYAARVWTQHLILSFARRRQTDLAILVLCRWMLRLACTRRDFASNNFTTLIALPEGFCL